MTPEDFRIKLGNGNWEYFDRSGVSLDMIFEAAADWAAAAKGIERPWLCWNVDPDWNVVQQRLVRSAGWTPLVGFDPRVGPPPVEDGAVLIDFNARLKLPVMWMHFPMEFVHLFAPRLAFWHSDLLVRPAKMRSLADRFAALPDGTTAAVKPRQGWRGLLHPKRLRYWELIGCTTAGASRDAFAKGAGWWVSFADHPSNSPEERLRRSSYYWDAGTGIRYWHKHCGGKVDLIPESFVEEGHFTRIGRKDYKLASPDNHLRDLAKELPLNFELAECCRKLGLEQFLAR